MTLPLGHAPADALDALLQVDHPLKRAVTTWADENLPDSLAVGEDQTIGSETLLTAGQAGILGAMCPREYGGSDLSVIDTMLILEGLGSSKADNGIVFALSCLTIVTARAISITGTDAQKARFLPAHCRGEVIGAFAMTEDTPGSDPWQMATTASQLGNGSWVISGRKRWSTFAPICDMALIFAQTNGQRGAWGITAFLVDADTPGFTRATKTPKMGLTACPWGDLVLEDCEVEPDAVLGRVGAGAAIFRNIVEYERALLYATIIGSLERTIRLCERWIRDRSSDGRPIGAHQSVAHRLVDMKVGHEASRLLLYKAAALADRGVSVTRPAALAKLHAAEVAVQGSIDALRTFGAAGYAGDQEIERQLRDALAGLSASGTSDVARNLVARLDNLDRPLPPS